MDKVKKSSLEITTYFIQISALPLKPEGMLASGGFWVYLTFLTRKNKNNTILIKNMPLTLFVNIRLSWLFFKKLRKLNGPLNRNIYFISIYHILDYNSNKPV